MIAPAPYKSREGLLFASPVRPGEVAPWWTQIAGVVYGPFPSQAQAGEARKKHVAAIRPAPASLDEGKITTTLHRGGLCLYWVQLGGKMYGPYTRPHSARRTIGNYRKKEVTS